MMATVEEVPAAQAREIRVLLVDDQPLVRRGLRTLLELEDDLRVVAEAGDGQEALELAALLPVDVALVDAQMPTMDGVELISQLTSSHPQVACLMLTTFEDEEILAQSLRAGARGHLLKDIEPEELFSAIRHVRQGRTVLGSMATDHLVARYLAHGSAPGAPQIDLTRLSQKENVVARHVATGLTNREIARALFISEGTVKNHVSAILRKLDLRDRTALAIKLRDVAG